MKRVTAALALGLLAAPLARAQAPDAPPAPFFCLPGFTSPMRMVAGEIECAALNGRDCLWGVCDANAPATKAWWPTVDPTTLRPLACGATSLRLWGVDGYSDSNHWCAKVCLAFGCPNVAEPGLSVEGKRKLLAAGNPSQHCGEWLEQYHINPGHDFGKAPADVQASWRWLSCDAVICQYFTEHYGVAPGQSWGTLPPPYQKMWMTPRTQCTSHLTSSGGAIVLVRGVAGTISVRGDGHGGGSVTTPGASVQTSNEGFAVRTSNVQVSANVGVTVGGVSPDQVAGAIDGIGDMIRKGKQAKAAKAAAKAAQAAQAADAARQAADAAREAALENAPPPPVPPPLVAVAVAATPPPAQAGTPPAALPPPAAVAAPVAAPSPAPTDLGAICERTAVASTGGAKRVGEFFDCEGKKGGRCDFPIQLDTGKCYFLVGAGDPEGIKALFLYLWGPDGKRITEAKGKTPNPVLAHCPEASGLFKFQVKVGGGSGGAKVGLYSKAR